MLGLPCRAVRPPLTSHPMMLCRHHLCVAVACLWDYWQRPHLLRLGKLQLVKHRRSTASLATGRSELRSQIELRVSSAATRFGRLVRQTTWVPTACGDGPTGRAWPSTRVQRAAPPMRRHAGAQSTVLRLAAGTWAGQGPHSSLLRETLATTRCDIVHRRTCGVACARRGLRLTEITSRQNKKKELLHTQKGVL